MLASFSPVSSRSALRAARRAFAALLVVSAWAKPAAADVTVFEAPSVGDLKVSLYGWVQPRFTWQENDTRPGVNFTPNPAFTILRTRLGTIATWGPWVRAQVEAEYAQESVKDVDMFVTFTPIHEKVASLNLTAGQFRVPISRQNLLPSVSYQFADVAYFVAPNFLVDRNIGAKLWSELFDKRLKLEVAMYNSNDLGTTAGAKTNSDKHFMYAARVEVAPLGPAPSFEGDLRPLGMQHHPVVTLGVSAMMDKLDAKQFDRKWLGADLAAYWEGASLYAEFFYHVDQGYSLTSPGGTVMMPPCPVPKGSPAGFEPACVRQLGWNVQAGYFAPLPWVREHLEVVARVESFDPAMDVKNPINDPDARDLTGANPQWGYMGYLFGLNYFLNHRHTAKAQVSYEIRNETKQCLQGQSLAMNNCTGYIANNLFVAQLTAGF